jgi:protein-S-isoprenylcysteine O-methyltransferase Ste14
MLAAYIFSAYALIENRFFSGVVRIQKDRGHRVISSGPYRWVRHPGYAGALITYLAIPFFLDSVWAFVPAVIICIAMVIRTRMEDETLQTELEGYRAYTQRVRYRLIPGVW